MAIIDTFLYQFIEFLKRFFASGKFFSAQAEARRQKCEIIFENRYIVFAKSSESQGPGLAGSGERGALDFFDQFVKAFQNFPVSPLPVEVIIPGVL